MLRDATEEDRERIRRWRNHPQVRRSSITTHEIGPEEHLAWWRSVHADDRRRLLVHEHGGRPCGVVTFVLDDPGPGAATWGFYLDVDGLAARGELLPAWLELERAAIRYAFDELGVRCLGGETLAWNTPVLQLHRRFGFRVTRTYRREVDGEPCDVVWTELTATDRQQRSRDQQP